MLELKPFTRTVLCTSEPHAKQQHLRPVSRQKGPNLKQMPTAFSLSNPDRQRARSQSEQPLFWLQTSCAKIALNPPPSQQSSSPRWHGRLPTANHPQHPVMRWQYDSTNRFRLRRSNHGDPSRKERGTAQITSSIKKRQTV